MGSSRDLAVGTVAVGSLLTASMLGQEVSFTENPSLYLHLAFTATFFAGVRPKPISLNGQRLLFVSFQQTSLLLFDGKDVTVNASKVCCGMALAVVDFCTMSLDCGFGLQRLCCG
ncbi:hypothetical protein CsatA_018971 [Cannabis sativa]